MDGAPNGTFDGYLFSANPDASTIWTSCFEVLKAKGAATYNSSTVFILIAPADKH